MSLMVRVFVPALPETEIVPAPKTKIMPDPFGPTGPPVLPSKNSGVPGKAFTFNGPACEIKPP